nr:reverse transcriptase domain-containing protein [Tanacetum cinerariifolium]
MATDGNSDPPVPDLQTMEDLCQPTLNGRGGPITRIAIQAMNFRLNNDMIQQVQNSFQFYGLPGDDANKHLDKFLHVTQSIKVNGVTDDALRLYLFPHSLAHHATAWFDHLLRNSINTFEQMAKMFLGKYFPPSMLPLAKLRTYMLREPITKVVILTNLKNQNYQNQNKNQGNNHGIPQDNNMHKAFPLLVRKFPLPEGTSHCLKKNATARRKVLPLPEVCTAIIVKEKPSVKDDRFL